MSDQKQPVLHQEAVTAANVRVRIYDLDWQLTLREGATEADVDNMLDLIAYASGRVHDMAPPKVNTAWDGVTGNEEPEYHNQVVPVPEDFRAPSERGNAPPVNGWNGNTGAGNTGAGGTEKIGRIVVSGTKERPLVEFYSTNQALRFPFVKTPASVVESVIISKYGDNSVPRAQLDKLYECGNEMPVTWQVSWEPSSKNPRWKDLVEVIL